MEEIRQHFDGEALSFDANIVRLIPYYDSMIDALVSSLPFGPASAFSVLDLGCAREPFPLASFRPSRALA